MKCFLANLSLESSRSTTALDLTINKGGYTVYVQHDGVPISKELQVFLN